MLQVSSVIPVLFVPCFPAVVNGYEPNKTRNRIPCSYCRHDDLDAGAQEEKEEGELSLAIFSG
jgi:hypothetical protein